MESDGTENPKDPDALIGANLARLRGEMTQAAVGEAMRKRGHKWSQATVWAVENGKRPLRLTEAISLSTILNRHVSDFAMMNWEAALDSAIEHVNREQGRLHRALEDFHHYQRNLRFLIADVRAAESAEEILRSEVMAVAEAVASEDQLSGILESARRTADGLIRQAEAEGTDLAEGRTGQVNGDGEHQ